MKKKIYTTSISYVHFWSNEGGEGEDIGEEIIFATPKYKLNAKAASLFKKAFILIDENKSINDIFNDNKRELCRLESMFNSTDEIYNKDAIKNKIEKIKKTVTDEDEKNLKKKTEEIKNLPTIIINTVNSYRYNYSNIKISTSSLYVYDEIK